MAWTTPATATAGSTALTAAFWNTQVRDNSLALYGAVRRLAYIERTTSYTTTATTLSTATDIFSSDQTFTADGTSSYLVVFYVSYMGNSNASGTVATVLTDGGNNGLGRFFAIQPSGANELQAGGIYQRFYTPAAGSRSLNVRAFVNAGTGTLGASDGTGTNDCPMFLAVYGPILT